MTGNRLRKLNRPFGEFGYTSTGATRFQWMRTAEMYFLVESGFEEVKTRGGLVHAVAGQNSEDPGLVVMQRTFRRISYADVYGPCWILAHWQEPIPRERWIAMFGDTVPWPSQGEFHPIDNVKMPPGAEPIEVHTEVACMAIRLHMKKMPAEVKAAYDATMAAEKKAVRDEIYDEMREADPAFLNPNPGARGGPVSFGGIKDTEGANTVQ
jgi:hypothetical protein